MSGAQESGPFLGPGAQDPREAPLVYSDLQMIEAYVLIHVEPGTTPSVSAAVSGATGVAWAEGLAGPYDVIARIKAGNLDQLANTVATEIQAADGVIRTLVCVVPGSEA